MSEPEEISFDPDPDQMQEVADGMRLVSADVSCENCAHVNVCSIIAGIKPMLEQWNRGLNDAGPPIDLRDMAVICDEYDPEE